MRYKFTMDAGVRLMNENGTINVPNEARNAVVNMYQEECTNFGEIFGLNNVHASWHGTGVRVTFENTVEQEIQLRDNGTIEEDDAFEDTLAMLVSILADPDDENHPIHWGEIPGVPVQRYQVSGVSDLDSVIIELLNED